MLKNSIFGHQKITFPLLSMFSVDFRKNGCANLRTDRATFFV